MAASALLVIKTRGAQHLSSSIAELVLSASRLAARELSQPSSPAVGRRPPPQKSQHSSQQPVPERRTQLHVVADDSLDNSLDEPECDDAGRSDTSCDSVELPVKLAPDAS